MRKFGTQKSNNDVKFELNPLNATMRAAFKTGLLARTFRKATPVMVVSIAAVGSNIWQPELGGKVFSPLQGFFISEAFAQTNVEVNSTSIVVPTPTATFGDTGTNVSVDLDTDSPAGIAEVIVTNNSVVGPPLDKKSSIVFNAFSKTASLEYGPVTITQLATWDTTVTLNAEDYASVTVTVSSSGSTSDTFTLTNKGTIAGDFTVTNNETATINNESRIRGSVIGVNSAGSLTIDNKSTGFIDTGVKVSGSGDSVTVKNAGSIVDGSETHAVFSNASATSLTVDNSGLIAVQITEGDVQGSAVHATKAGQVYVINRDGGVLSGDYAGIRVTDVGNLGSVQNSVSTVIISNNGTVSGDAGIYVNAVKSTPGLGGRTGDVTITNESNGTIFGSKGVGIALQGIDGDVQITNSGNITGTGVLPGPSQLSASNLVALAPDFIVKYDESDEGSYSAVGAAIALHKGRTTDVTLLSEPEEGEELVLPQPVSAQSLKITNTEGGRVVGEGLGFYGVYADITGPITVDNAGLIQGRSAEALYLVTSDTTGSDSVSVTVEDKGEISDFSRSPSARVIYVDSNESATLSIEEGGLIVGRVAMKSAVGDVVVNNSGTWRVQNAADSVAFSSANSASVVQIKNTGTIEIAGNTTFGTLTRFDNEGGIIDMRADGNKFSLLTLNFKNSTAPDFDDSEDFDDTFYGSANASIGSIVILDADLSGTLVSNNLTDDDGDRFDKLVINDKVVGTTKVEINDVAKTSPGVHVGRGETVISAYYDSEVSKKSAFVLKDGPINKGLWQYDLFPRIVEGDGGGDDYIEWRLASAPSEHAHELPVMQTAAQEAWHQGAAAWLDHTNNVRMRLLENNVVKGGAWARIVGADVKRENVNRGTQSYYGDSYSHQNNYEQDIYGVMFGADGAIELANGGTWLLGLTAGVTQSKVNFTTSTTDMDYTAGSVGAYASFVRGGGFFNALLKADMGSTDYKMSNGAGISANESFQTSAFGVMLDGGYRFRSGVAFIEPSLSVASVSAKIKDKEFLATNVDFSNGTSLRTKLTLATGFSAAWGGTRFEPYLALSAVHESDGENEVSLTSGGVDTPVQVKDKQVETYGQVGLGLKVVGAKGSSGFLKVEHAPSASDNDTTIGDAKREATTVSAGVKLTW